MLEIDEDINITLRPILAAGDKSKDTGVLHAVAFEDRGRFMPDFIEGNAPKYMRWMAGFDKFPDSRKTGLSHALSFRGQTKGRGCVVRGLILVGVCRCRQASLPLDRSLASCDRLGFLRTTFLVVVI